MKNIIPILTIGHSFIINENRKAFSQLGSFKNFNIDLITPLYWSSNLTKSLKFEFDDTIDINFSRVYPTKVYNKGNGSFYFFNFISLYKILNSKKYQRIFLAAETWSFSLLTLNVIKFFTKNKKTPIDLWVCQNLKKNKLKFLWPLEWFNCLSVEKILCCCSEISEVIDWKKIKIPCFYFPFSFAGENYQNIKQTISDNVVRFGYLGRLSNEKGLDSLAEAFIRFSKNHHSTLTIAGSGPEEEKWKELAKIHKNIFFTGSIKHNVAYQFYENIDVFVLPSLTTPFWKEQFGRVIIEAAAAGKTVIGSNSGAIPEVMGLLNMPYIFPENNSLELEKTMMSYLKDKNSGRLSSIISNAKDIAFRYFTHHNLAKRYSYYVNDQEAGKIHNHLVKLDFT